jgi:hypothetical protein
MSDKDYFGGRHVDDDAMQKCFVRRVMLGTLLGALVAACVLYSVRPARADAYRSKNGEAALVRHQTQCDDADILTHILRLGGGELLGQFKKATLTYGGREWRSCWIEIDGMVYSVDEEGAPMQAIPASLFKDGPSA